MEMNCLNNIGLTRYLFLLLLVFGISYAVDGALTQEVNSVTVLLTALPGEKPGQYYYRFDAGYNLRPKCFAIDPNDRAFYIPEVDTKYRIRIHKFDKTGKFTNMFKLEQKAYLISDITVDVNGDIYLYCNFGSDIYCCVIRCDKEGKILNMFGTKGPITNEEIAKSGIRSQENDIYRDEFFRGNCKYLSIVNGYLEVSLTNEYDVSSFYRFNGKTGQKINENTDIPVNIEEAIKKRKEKIEVVIKESIKQNKRIGITHTLIGPYGEFYYMSVNKEYLEIAKVTFKSK